ncbi:hypothetical protein BX600DRAFT_155526 [Xylariales sp. PMI_506]|nr:hypothetical protein BX600DRAFT_155526 [Xylariales sp. PMI_506]
MEFILTNILGRGNSPNDPSERDVEDQREHPRREDGSGRGVASRFLRRPQLPSIRLRRNSGDAQQARTTTVMNEVDSPKTPIFQLGAPSLPSTRLHLPHLNRTWTRDSTDGPSPVPSRAPSNANGRTPRPSMQQSRARPEENENVALPEPVRQGRDSGGRRAMRRFRGADPAEVHLANLAETGRRRARRRGSGDDASQPDAEGRGKPKRFMYCFPPIKSRRIRKQIVRCLISGFFLTLLLSICKSFPLHESGSPAYPWCYTSRS